MQTPLFHIRGVESALDRWLRGLPSLACNGDKAVALACDGVEEGYLLGAPQPLERGLYTLAPYWMGQPALKAPEQDELLDDLARADQAYRLREYLHYTYTVPGAMRWTLDGARAAAAFAGPAIARRLFLTLNRQILNTLDLITPTEAPHPTADAMSARRLECAYSPLDPADTAPLGAYTYRDFHAIYRALLTRALAQVAQARSQDLAAPVTMPMADLARAVTAETGLPAGTCQAVLQDVCYSVRARNARIPPSTYALYELPGSGEVLLPPHHFALWDGPLHMLRVTASRTPGLFQRDIAPRLQARFVAHVAGLFRERGFAVVEGKALQRTEPPLAEADLLLVAPGEAPVVYLCTVSSPVALPWAPEQLQWLDNPAMVQLRGRREMSERQLASAAGRSHLHPHLAPGAEAAPIVRALAVTPPGAGMLVAEDGCTVIDYDTLHQVLTRLPGGAADVVEGLAQLPAWADSCYEVAETEAELGPVSVRYPEVVVRQLMDFEPGVSGAPATSRKVGRNDPCPCGSGLKYKKCCGCPQH